MKPLSCLLTIAGSDSGAGAGIQADARTAGAMGVYACTAITAVTAQNSRGVRAWRPVSPDLIAAQIETVLADFPIGAIKTGLLPGAAAVRAVARALARKPKIPLVVDPVLGSTSGTRFLPPAGVKALREELLPRAALITPNWPEAELLSGLPVRNLLEVEAAARALAAAHGCAVLLKGGHGPGGECHDCLVLPHGRMRWLVSPRLATPHTHGTGCVLSAGIAAGLARGLKLEPAVVAAHAFLQQALRDGKALRWRGRGPAFAGARR
jgi:hydroxymethylpyrimidine/phosphomethylpyrimidine kinase